MAQDNVEDKEWTEKNQGTSDNDDGSGSDTSDGGSGDDDMSVSGSEDEGMSTGESVDNYVRY